MTALLLRLATSRIAGPVAISASLALAVMLAAARLEVSRLERRIADAQAAETKAVQTAAEIEARRLREVRDVEARAATALRAARESARALIKEVPVYVPAEADARCIVADGFVRLHDAAAAGALPAVSGPAAVPDGAASSVALSDVGRTVVENYGIAHENAQQLNALQEWVAAISAAAN